MPLIFLIDAVYCSYASYIASYVVYTDVGGSIHTHTHSYVIILLFTTIQLINFEDNKFEDSYLLNCISL